MMFLVTEVLEHVGFQDNLDGHMKLVIETNKVALALDELEQVVEELRIYRDASIHFGGKNR